MVERTLVVYEEPRTVDGRWIPGSVLHEATVSDLVEALQAEGVGRDVGKGLWFGGAMSVIRGRFLVVPLGEDT